MWALKSDGCLALSQSHHEYVTSVRLCNFSVPPVSSSVNGIIRVYISWSLAQSKPIKVCFYFIITSVTHQDIKGE